MAEAPKILITRTDRLGDLMLALPCVEWIRKALPQSEIHLLCQEPYLELLAPYLTNLKVKGLAFEPKNDWANELGKEEYDGVLFLFGPPEMALATRRANIPVRVGVYSKPHSFFAFNKGAFQGRSRAKKNEAEYNLDLARLLVRRFLDKDIDLTLPPVSIPGDSHSKLQANRLLDQIGITSRIPFIILHPGLGGSAITVSAKGYVSFIDALRKSRKRVILSVGPSALDEEVAENILRERPHLKVIRNIALPILREVFRQAAQVVAPSTGPLHLAHYVGTPTIGLYSPVRSQHASRWAPWGGSGRVTVLSPEVDCPATRDCLGDRCDKFPCMDNLPEKLPLREM